MQPQPSPAPVKRQDLAICLGILVISIAVWLLVASSSPWVGNDFTTMYVVGLLPRADLYHWPAIIDLAHKVVPPGTPEALPYVRPAVFLFPSRVLALLPFRYAFGLWIALSVAFYGAVFLMGVRRFRVRPELVAFLGLFFPAVYSIITGQDSTMIALVYAIGIALLAMERDTAAGLVLSLAVYKFNLALLLPLLLIAQRRFRALIVFGAGAAALALASALTVPPGDYVRLLASISNKLQPPSMRGLSYAIGFPALFYVSVPLIAVAAFLAMRRVGLELAYSISALGALLCAAYGAVYDGTTLFLPLCLVIGLPGLPKYLKLLAVILLAAAPVWLLVLTAVPILTAALFFGLCWFAMRQPVRYA